MTRAPQNLLAVRDLLLTHLNIDKSRVRAADLEPAEVGIVGDKNHRGGYHCGSDRVVRNDYLRNWLISPVGTSGLVTPPSAGSPLRLLLAMAQAWPALVAQVTQLSQTDFTDEQQIISGVLAGLPAEEIAAAIPPQLARDVADELSRRLTA